MTGTSERIFGLDLMRAIAILVVVYMHGAFLLPDVALPLYNLPVPAIDGVAIFFALSGFLIGGILLKVLEGPRFGMAEVAHFWMRRWFRTVPAYVVALTLVTLLPYAFGDSSPFFSWKLYFFLQNLYSKPPRFFPESWSLSVEEWFYLLLPLMVLLATLLVKLRRKAVLWVALTMLVVPLGLRLWFYVPHPEDVRHVMFFTKIVVLRYDAIMYGVLMAYLWRYHRDWCLRWKVLGLVICLAMVVGMTLEMRLGPNGAAYRAIWVPTLEPLAAALALPFLASWRSTRYAWLARPITFVSTISYSIYLVNLTLVQRTLIPALTGEVSWKVQPTLAMGGLRLAMFWVMTLVLAYAMYRLVEQPMRDLREKIKPPGGKVPSGGSKT